MGSALTKTRVWLGTCPPCVAYCSPCLTYWQWSSDAWMLWTNAYLRFGNVFILKSDRPTKPKRKPGLLRACYTAKDLGA